MSKNQKPKKQFSQILLEKINSLGLIFFVKFLFILDYVKILFYHKSRKEVLKATAELREKNKPAEEPAKPTEAELLTSILEELKKQNAAKTK